MADSRNGYPRVLVVSAPPMDGRGGTGVTLANLFSSVPPGRVSQVHLDQGSVDPGRCGSSLLLPSKGSPLEGWIRSRFTHMSRAAHMSPTIVAARPKDAGRARAWASALLDLAPVQLTPATKHWATEHRPDVIYSQLGSIRVLRVVNRLAECLGVPVVPHFMDDWKNTLYSQGELLGVARSELRRQVQAVVDRSPLFLGISAAMVDEYAADFDRPGRAFMNCVADDALSRASVVTPPTVRVLTYVGGLHLERWRSLARLADQLGKIAPEAELRIHAPKEDLQAYQKHFEQRNNVSWGPSLAPQSVHEALAKADVLVHVESWSPEARLYTRLSISTKVPQYLASGRPILAIGPPELASMRYILETGGGEVLSESDTDGLRSFLVDARGRTEMAQLGLTQAKAHHSQSAVSEAFLRTLDEVARGAAG